MKAKKYKHLSFEDRCVIEEFLNHHFNFSQIAYRLGKDRTSISKEVLKHRFLRGSACSAIIKVYNTGGYGVKHYFFKTYQFFSAS